ncbi:type II secretion system F family protein [Ralstonia pseudosolanacearum]|uniref:type II secretion system F family protein n=1 Tax=Ralstonia pseudosolanacearum TaxID=1310165 RepID=UPI000B3B8BEF|nr:type II secretion system F family protein [Ralstonia pseudosolanacearum]ARU25513.1 hypothetical protein RSSE_p1330 [Ralstonia solanacearum]MDO3623189.1 type II secretion system F family protein [Ralstonia pseudosolanacearum]
MRFKVSTFHPDTARVSTRTVAAEDRASVETRLKAEGVMVLSVEPIENKLARSLQSRRRKVDAGLVCIELGGLLRAGLTVSEALDSLAHRDDHPNVGVYRQLYDGLLSGLPLSESMKQVEGVFPGILVAAIQANERSGRIPDALDEYAKYAQAQEALRKKVVSAAVYPATVIGFGLLVVLFLLAYVIPRFAMVYDGTAMQMSGPTRILLAVGHFIHDRGWGLLVGIALLGVIVADQFARRNAAQRLLNVIGGLWPFKKLGERFQQARICASLAMLTRGGYDFPEAMRLASPLAISASTRTQLDAARERILEGVLVSQALMKTDFSDGFAVRILQAGERVGDLAGSFEMLAQTYRRELETMLERTMRLVEPILLMTVASLIGAIVVLMYLPIFDLAGAI